MDPEQSSEVTEEASFVAPKTGYPFKEFRAEETETPLSSEQSLSNFEQLLKETKRLILVTDLDGTVVPYTPNPKDCRIHPKAQEAFRIMRELGIGIAAMTGRAGPEGARLIGIPGATIIGTAGWEVCLTDADNPYKGVSYIHEKFHPLAEDITHLLREVRTTFFQKVINSPGDNETQELTSEIQTPDGLIVFEKKAINWNFPEGLSINFNFNQIKQEKWGDYIQAIRDSYEKNLPESLKTVYRLNISQSTTGPFLACSISITPHGEEGKEKSLVQLLRTNEETNPVTSKPRRREYFKDVPGGYDGVIFFGDTNQDAKALRAAHLMAVVAGRKATGVLVARPGHGAQENAARYADVATDQIDGNAELYWNSWPI